MPNSYESLLGINLSEKSAEYTEKVKANEMNPIVGVYTSLLNLGTDAVADRRQKKYIQSTNFVAINTFLASLIYLSMAIFWEQWYWLNSIIALNLTCLGVLFMNGFGRINISRITFIVGVNALLFVNALFVGPMGQGGSFFIIIIIVPFLIYDIKDTLNIAIGVLLPLLFIYLVSVIQPMFAGYHLPLPEQELLYKVGIVLQFLLCLAVIYQFVFYSRQAENELEASRQQMSLQTNELKRSNSDLEQFAYIISHDLKAPVRNISSFMNLLVNKHGPGMNPEAREFVEYSRNGAKRMERLIDDVLSYCRIGTNLPKPTPVNLNDVVSTIRFELHERLNTAKGNITISKELPVINNVHSTLMYHVFQNLITNGLKFNKSEHPEITIGWTN
ncbi:MAG TPA: histidine kinase dimerization/phospho-acceptor domain-containing protein, partial [Chitinophagales bacterium]|nr:histidine kinase dimerization/phospho-acceptor domain-containing protein [Chitinophagales bacterium]